MVQPASIPFLIVHCDGRTQKRDGRTCPICFAKMDAQLGFKEMCSNSPIPQKCAYSQSCPLFTIILKNLVCILLVKPIIARCENYNHLWGGLQLLDILPSCQLWATSKWFPLWYITHTSYSCAPSFTLTHTHTQYAHSHIH